MNHLSSKDGDVPPNRPDGDVLGGLYRNFALLRGLNRDLLTLLGPRKHRLLLVGFMAASVLLIAFPGLTSNFESLIGDAFQELERCREEIIRRHPRSLNHHGLPRPDLDALDVRRERERIVQAQAIRMIGRS